MTHETHEYRLTLRHHNLPILSPLQEEGLSQWSLTDPVLRELIPLYTCKFIDFITSSNLLPTSAAFSIPWCPLCCSYCPTVVSSSCNMFCIGTIFPLIDRRISVTPVCSLINSTHFMSLKVIPVTQGNLSAL